MEAVCLYPLGLQETSQLFGATPCGAIDDGPARLICRQMGGHYLVDISVLLTRGRLHHHELQVGPLSAPVEDLEIDGQFFTKVVNDLGLDVGLGRGGEAQYRGDRLIPSLLSDETAHIPIIGAEVVSPLGEAMRLIQHPTADLSLIQRPPKRDTAKLLRRHDDDTRVPEPHPIQRVGPFRHGKKTINGHTGTNTFSF